MSRHRLQTGAGIAKFRVKGQGMTHSSLMEEQRVDCFILGGGITGAGVARDAAIRGLSLMLADSHDFASGTSHLTSKLIHGGLRYLGQWQLGLVRQGVRERNRLLNELAPNLVRPLRFVIPFDGRQRSGRLAVTTALSFYDLLGLFHGGRRSRALSAAETAQAYPYMVPTSGSMTFWDARANDARLVISVLRSAEELGASLLNYTRIESAVFDGSGWRIELHHGPSGKPIRIRAGVLVNATGPWAPLTSEMLGLPTPPLCWLKGSHILLNRPAGFPEEAMVFYSRRDGRPLWAVPWEQRVLVGTTESRYEGDPRTASPVLDEVADLFHSFRATYPGLAIALEDLRAAFSGVRPIVDQRPNRDERLSRHHEVTVNAETHLVTVRGGKLTTFRHMAECAADRVQELLGVERPNRRGRFALRYMPLWPGVVTPGKDDLAERIAIRARQSHACEATIKHLIRHYGVDASAIVAEMFKDHGLSRPLIDGLPFCKAELRYLCRQEHVVHLADLLKRRTPLYFLADRDAMDILPEITESIASVMGWGPARQDEEMNLLLDEFQRDNRAVEQFRVGHVPPAVPAASLELAALST